MDKLVSIITPSYNSERFINECIQSVIAQTYTNWEMLIVDDFSRDNSSFIIKDFSENEERIKCFLLDKNIGPAQARNIAIRQAKGKYIAFLDSDDLWESDKLEKQISFMKKNNIVFSYTTYQLISEDGLDRMNIIKAPKKMSYHHYLKDTIIGCLTVVIDREEAGGFEMLDVRSSHDMVLWLLIMKRGFDAYGLDQNLARYRVVSTSNTASKWRAAKDVWRVYRKVEMLSLHYSIWCFLNYALNALLKRI